VVTQNKAFKLIIFITHHSVLPVGTYVDPWETLGVEGDKWSLLKDLSVHFIQTFLTLVVHILKVSWSRKTKHLNLLFS
jgi:hypothetical protein